MIIIINYLVIISVTLLKLSMIVSYTWLLILKIETSVAIRRWISLELFIISYYVTGIN